MKRINTDSLKIYIFSFVVIISFELLSGLSFGALEEKLIYFISPLVICLLIVRILPKNRFNKVISYFLFFTVLLSSIFGFTKTLTGFPVSGGNNFIFGFPFFTAFLAYQLFFKKNKLNDFFIAANPLLLVTGPIGIVFNSLKNSNLKRRFNVFFPYIVIGVFFFKILSMPLVYFLPMVQNTDIPSILLFAIIFEIFIYFNFSGLSLIIFGIFGLMGIQIPLNFKQPFSSRTLVGYWKGWHLSLSAVLKELFYKPARKTNLPFAVFLVFMSSALWHGLSFNFILWGLFQASAYLLSIFLLKKGFLALSPYLMIASILIGRLLFLENDEVRFLLKLDAIQSLNFSIQTIELYSKNSILSLLMGLVIVTLEFMFYKNVYFKNRTYKFLRIPIVQTGLIFLTLFLISSNSNFAVYGQR